MDSLPEWVIIRLLFLWRGYYPNFLFFWRFWYIFFKSRSIIRPGWLCYLFIYNRHFSRFLLHSLSILVHLNINSFVQKLLYVFEQGLGFDLFIGRFSLITIFIFKAVLFILFYFFMIVFWVLPNRLGGKIHR